MLWIVELYDPETGDLLSRSSEVKNAKEAFEWLEQQLIFHNLPKITKQGFNLLSSKVNENGTYSKSNLEVRKYIKIIKSYKEPKKSSKKSEESEESDIED